MKLEQELRQRTGDGKWEVWQKLGVDWWFQINGAPEGDERSVRLQEWLPVFVSASKLEAIRFWNRSHQRERAPISAGDGFGDQYSDAISFATAALKRASGDPISM
jgi:hypothetical protein